MSSRGVGRPQCGQMAQILAVLNGLDESEAEQLRMNPETTVVISNCGATSGCGKRGFTNPTAVRFFFPRIVKAECTRRRPRRSCRRLSR